MVSYFIKPRPKNNLTSIYCSVNFHGVKRFTFRLTNITINKRDWKNGRMTTGRGKQEIGRIQSILDNLCNQIEEFFKEHLKVYRRKPTREEILKYIHSEKKLEDYIQPKTVADIIPEIEKVIEGRKTGFDLYKGRRFSENTIKSYGTFLASIQEFEKHRKNKLNTKNILLEETILEFQGFLTSKKNFQLNTVGERMKHLNTFLQVLKKKRVIDFNPFREHQIGIPEEGTISIALEESELEDLEKLDLSNHPTYEKVRDQFLLMCWTGLRISDFRNFIDMPKEGDIVTTINQKTRQEAHIPLFPATRRIIDKYNGILPRLISEQKMRDYIKVIGSDVKTLKRSVEVEYTKGGKRVKVLKKRFEMLGLHTARRTLATTLYKYDISLEDIMLITGHRTIKSLKKYLKVSDRDVLKDVLKRVQDRVTKDPIEVQKR